MTKEARDRGATAVEVALLLPILLILVMGIIDFGRALNAQITITQAAREGVRVAALKQSNPSGRAKDAAARFKNDVSVAVTSCPASPPGDATVKVTYTFDFITPVGGLAGLFGGGDFGDPIALNATGVMPCES